MFGYVKAYQPELKMREFDIYKGVYCSVCKQLKKRYGPFATLLLNYDVTFYALFALGVNQSCPGFKKGRCPFNPLKKCTFINCDNEIIALAADITVIMSFYKLKDNLSDSKWYKKILCVMLLPFFSIIHRKAKRRAPEAEKIVHTAMMEQSLTENNKGCSLDEAAHPSSNALGELFVMIMPQRNEDIYRFGYMLGRWVYLIDALDDYEKDKKDGCFNPLIKKDDPLTYAKDLIEVTASELIEVSEQITFNKFKPIINNIITDGLLQAERKVFASKGEA